LLGVNHYKKKKEYVLFVLILLIYIKKKSISRYDAHSHSITDYPAKGHPYEIFPGQDYSNPRVKDFMSGKRNNCIKYLNS
jgi:hypothetical protein